MGGMKKNVDGDLMGTYGRSYVDGTISPEDELLLQRDLSVFSLNDLNRAREERKHREAATAMMVAHAARVEAVRALIEEARATAETLQPDQRIPILLLCALLEKP